MEGENEFCEHGNGYRRGTCPECNAIMEALGGLDETAKRHPEWFEDLESEDRGKE